MRKIGKFTVLKLDAPIVIDEIVTMHYFKYSKDFHFAGEKHDFWEIAYVDQGEVGVLAEKQGLILKQGEAIFHKPNEYHNIWANNRFADVIILSFVCKSPAMSFFENKIMPFNDEQKSILAKLVSMGEIYLEEPLDDVYQTKLTPQKSGPFGLGQMIKNYMELLFISLIQENSVQHRTTRATGTAKRQGENKVVDVVLEYLNNNVYHHITLDDVLRETCFSKSYITKLFRDYNGVSIMGHYMDMKIEEAKKLLCERKLSFTEISEKLGFSSIHHFSSTFKKKTRMTPSEYRKTVEARAIR
jgi:AraC-like DNA-binding protein/quercetin dioxygenase-like cupin family protein